MPIKNIVVVAVAAIISLTCYSATSKNRYANLFAEAMEIIEREALLRSDKRDLFDSSMEGMLSGFDRNSTFISGRRYQLLEEDLRQEFGGVGMYVDVEPATNRLFVLAPMPGSPANRAGVLPGDAIVAIDGKAVTGDDRTEAIEMMRGPSGTSVSVSLLRDEKRLEVTIAREEIPVESVHGDWLHPDGVWEFVLQDYPRIGYIRLLQFGDRTTEEFQQALEGIAHKIDGLIIDLRNNSGGLLNSAVDICDLFLPNGKLIVETRGRNERVVSRHTSSEAVALASGVPVVVLVNRNSASASEIVAACLQDQNRAIVIGERTYGKGTVQNLIPLERNVSAIKLTTASYWRPSGKNIDRVSSEQSQDDDWGVSPNPAFTIVMDEEEVFENYRQRNLRDLQGIRLTQSGRPGPKPEPVPDVQDLDSTTGDPDSHPDDTSDSGETVYVDRPLQKAIELLSPKASANIQASAE